MPSGLKCDFMKREAGAFTADDLRNSQRLAPKTDWLQDLLGKFRVQNSVCGFVGSNQAI